jgi:hypothetical protein
VHRGYGRTKGPAICDKDGFQLGSRDMNLKFWEALTHIWERTPKLFLSNIKTADDIEFHFSVYRSFRGGLDSRAIEQVLEKTVTDTVNRWKVIQRSGGSKPGHGSMSQYYADATLLKKVHVIACRILVRKCGSLFPVLKHLRRFFVFDFVYSEIG